MKIDFVVLLLAALVPLVVGFLWYGKMLFGKAWMEATGVTEESAKGANMPLIFGLTYLFSFFMCMAIQFMVIHQISIFGVLQAHEAELHNPTSELSMYVQEYLAKWGGEFRTFKHGAFHGTLAGVMLVLPIISINAMFERKGFKYIAINVGYFTVCLAIMGGIICQFAKAY